MATSKQIGKQEAEARGTGRGLQGCVSESHQPYGHSLVRGLELAHPETGRGEGKHCKMNVLFTQWRVRVILCACSIGAAAAVGAGGGGERAVVHTCRHSSCKLRRLQMIPCSLPMAAQPAHTQTLSHCHPACQHDHPQHSACLKQPPTLQKCSLPTTVQPASTLASSLQCSLQTRQPTAIQPAHSNLPHSKHPAYPQSLSPPTRSHNLSSPSRPPNHQLPAQATSPSAIQPAHAAAPLGHWSTQQGEQMHTHCGPEHSMPQCHPAQTLAHTASLDAARSLHPRMHDE